MTRLLACLGLLVLAACATNGDREPRPRVEGECKPEPGRRFIGQIATGEIGRKLLAATGARVIRWVPPRTQVTMDFRADRLTVSYDDSMIIERVACT